MANGHYKLAITKGLLTAQAKPNEIDISFFLSFKEIPFLYLAKATLLSVN